MSGGWFAMSRAMFDHPIFAGHADRVGVWAWMVATAAWKDTRQDADGQTVTVKRGQILTSYRQMSKATGAGVQVIRTLIARLKDENAINTDLNTGRLLITIRNYDKYQNAGNRANTRPTQDQHTKETREQYNTLEANASSDGKPSELLPVSLVTQTMWTVGVRYLVSKGIGDNQARKFLGKCRSQSDDVSILRAVEAAHKSGTEDPIPYIVAALKPEPVQRSASDIAEQLRREGRL